MQPLKQCLGHTKYGPFWCRFSILIHYPSILRIYILQGDWRSNGLHSRQMLSCGIRILHWPFWLYQWSDLYSISWAITCVNKSIKIYGKDTLELLGLVSPCKMQRKWLKESSMLLVARHDNFNINWVAHLIQPQYLSAKPNTFSCTKISLTGVRSVWGTCAAHLHIFPVS